MSRATGLIGIGNNPGTPTAWLDVATNDYAPAFKATNTQSGASVQPNFYSLVGAVGNRAFDSRLIGDTIGRLLIFGDGKHEWGPGGSVGRDTNLYRSAAATLATDSKFVALGGLKISNSSTTGYVCTATDTLGNGAWTLAPGGSGTVTSVAVSGGTTGLTTSGGPVTSSGTITLAGILAVLNGGTGTTTSTGSGANVLATSPALIAPDLGTPASAVLTNTTGLPVATGISGLGTGVVTALTAAVNGSGAVSLTTSPAFVTPNLGTPSAAVMTNATGTAASLTAGNATKLATARTIAGVSFDGSANIAIASTGLSNTANIALDTNTLTLTNKNLTSVTNTFPTLNQNTTGTAANVTGTVAVANGGTGVGTLTGIVKGTGTTALTAATAGTDYLAPTSTISTRINPRVATTTSSATPTPAGDTTDTYVLTAQAAAAAFANPTGTPVDEQKLSIRIKANGAFPITWGTLYQASGVAALLTTTVSGKTIRPSFIYDATAVKWVCLAVDAVGY